MEETPNKRIKLETLTPPNSPPSLDKGKAPITPSSGDIPAEKPPPQSCGVCFAEEGRSVRGMIDSCHHYYCFLCIVEWSKIESRCPLCRARFGSIRRVRRDGSFIGDGAVRVPVRDQLYDPFGDPADPYGQARCSVCSGTHDETLLLLCDLCDSAWHTYCAGLGFTVPEGDWFCNDCTLLRSEQHDSQMDDNMDSSANSEHVDDVKKEQVDEPQSTPASVSIFDIVRESSPEVPDSGADRLLKLVSHPTTFSSSAIVSDQKNHSCTGSLQGARGNSNSLVEMRDSSARTLSNCRNVHKHISLLRENWDAFRSGSLSFSSDLLSSSGKGSQKGSVTIAAYEGSSLKSSLQLRAKTTVCDASRYQQAYNVQRAWKLMSIAKSMQDSKRSKSASKTSYDKAHGLKVDNFVPECVIYGKRDVRCSQLRVQKLTNNRSGKLGQSSQKFTGIVPVTASTSNSKHQNSCVSEFSTSREGHTPARSDMCHKEPLSTSHGKSGRRVSDVVFDGYPCSTSSCRPITIASVVSSTNLPRSKVSTFPLKQVRKSNICINKEEEQSFRADFCHDRAGLLSHENVGRGLSNISVERNGSACSTCPYETTAGGSDGSCVKIEGKEISISPRKVGPKITKAAGKDDEVKNEILSLVKLNLKLLSKDKRLGTDSFKEIARLSTHTILASCGFEHRKIVSWRPTLVCRHVDQLEQLRRCAIVPSSCHKCFYVFVNDVVNSIMSQKLNSTGVAN